MSLVRSKDKRTGITYVYESESYWDKEKKQPRARRKLIGKIDEATGEIVPTDGRGRKRKSLEAEPDVQNATGAEVSRELSNQLEQKDSRIAELEAEVQKLRAEKASLMSEIRSILENHK